MKATRTFRLADQQRFAELSGDRNPLHLDPAWARTVFPGQVVVHGMHGLLWALDCLAPDFTQGGLTATFLKPIFLDEDVGAKRNGDTITVTVRNQSMLIARLTNTPTIAERAGESQLPLQWRSRGGAVRMPSASNELATLFPHLVDGRGLEAVKGLAALSTLVGMECPGLHSMFSEFAIRFVANAAPMGYLVNRFDKRFSRVQMLVEGQGICGAVEAFDTAPVESLLDSSDPRIGPQAGAFAGQRPLIVGGSGGLGGVAASLLAQGAAKPVITYFGSRDAANALSERIRARGGMCDLLRLDVANPADGLAELAAMNWSGGEVYYFASPRIFRRRLEDYQGADFHDFARVYVDGFYDVVNGLLALPNRKVRRIFYPSSIAVEPLQSDLLEYALAKLSGEALCRVLERKSPGLRIDIERLPRIETRQTRSIVKVPAKSAVEAMLPIVNRMQRAD